MFSPRAPLTAAFMALMLLACGYIAIHSLLTWLQKKPVVYTINDPKDANTIWRSDTPLSYFEAVAIGKCPIPLPSDASNIRYVDFYAGYGGFARYVRFEAPVAVCRSHARKILEEYNARTVGNISLTVDVSAKPFDKLLAQSMASFVQQEMEEVVRAEWFDTAAIHQGEIWGAFDNHKPLILIDTERGVFYYLISD